MTQQEIYELCIEYGACVEAYIRTRIEDIKNGDTGPDDAMAAIMIGIESDLIGAGVKIDNDERRKKVKERIASALI